MKEFKAILNLISGEKRERERELGNLNNYHHQLIVTLLVITCHHFHLLFSQYQQQMRNCNLENNDAMVNKRSSSSHKKTHCPTVVCWSYDGTIHSYTTVVPSPTDSVTRLKSGDSSITNLFIFF